MGARVLGPGDLGRFCEGDGICAILHIETRARAAILTAAPASTHHHSPSCAHRCPAITCPCGGSRLSALYPGILVAVALQDATPFTGIREPTTPKRNTVRFLVHRSSSVPSRFLSDISANLHSAFCILNCLCAPYPGWLGESLPPIRPLSQHLQQLPALVS